MHSTEGRDDIESVLKGCVRAEKIDAPSFYIPYILEKSKFIFSLVKNSKNLNKKYNIEDWTDSDNFIKQVAIKKGKLKKGGEPDI